MYLKRESSPDIDVTRIKGLELQTMQNQFKPLPRPLNVFD